MISAQARARPRPQGRRRPGRSCRARARGADEGTRRAARPVRATAARAPRRVSLCRLPRTTRWLRRRHRRRKHRRGSSRICQGPLAQVPEARTSLRAVYPAALSPARKSNFAAPRCLTRSIPTRVVTTSSRRSRADQFQPVQSHPNAAPRRSTGAPARANRSRVFAASASVRGVSSVQLVARMAAT